jgi:hypothetical protein
MSGTLNETYYINPLNVELNPICHLLALLGAHYILQVSRIRVNIVDGGTTHSVARQQCKRIYFWISMATLNDFSSLTASVMTTNIRSYIIVVFHDNKV